METPNITISDTLLMALIVIFAFAIIYFIVGLAQVLFINKDKNIKSEVKELYLVTKLLAFSLYIPIWIILLMGRCTVVECVSSTLVTINSNFTHIRKSYLLKDNEKNKLGIGKIYIRNNSCKILYYYSTGYGENKYDERCIIEIKPKSQKEVEYSPTYMFTSPVDMIRSKYRGETLWAVDTIKPNNY